MRFQHLKRILMQAVGDNAGGGTGAPPAQPSTPPAAPPPAAPSTPPAAPAPGAPPAALSPEMARIVENSVNAALRRAGVLGTNGTPPQGAPAPAAPAATPASAPAPDLSRLRALDRALTATGRGAQLEDAAYQRLERDFVAEQPPDARTWVESYFRGFGVVQTAATPAPATPPAGQPAAPAPNTPPATQPPPAAAAPAGTQPPQPNGQPASNAGGPPAPREHPEDIDLISASEADRAHLLKNKGLKWYTDTYERQLRDRRVRVR